MKKNEELDTPAKIKEEMRRLSKEVTARNDRIRYLRGVMDSMIRAMNATSKKKDDPRDNEPVVRKYLRHAFKQYPKLMTSNELSRYLPYQLSSIPARVGKDLQRFKEKGYVPLYGPPEYFNAEGFPFLDRMPDFDTRQTHKINTNNNIRKRKSREQGFTLED